MHQDTETTPESREPGNVVQFPTSEIANPAKWTALPPAPAPAPDKTNGKDASATVTTPPAPAPAPAYSGYTKYQPPAPPAPKETPPIPEKVCDVLSTILTWPRTHDSKAEQVFNDWLIGHLNKLGFKPKARSMGCLSVEVPYQDGRRCNVLFVAHVDTVDGYDKDGFMTPDGKVLRKALTYTQFSGDIEVDPKNTVGGCLGADDGVGVWILLRMIQAGVPGSYLFTRGEEKGRLGAGAMTRSPSDSEWLKTFYMSVEFDRPRNYEVITHQSGGTRCASDSFGKALAAAFNVSDHLAYETSMRGVYTDNYDFRGLIPENVNIGVGYTDQHGTRETLDYGHAHALMTRCLTIDWEALPVERKAEIESYGGRSGGYWANGRWHNNSSVYGGYGGGAGAAWPDDDDLPLFGGVGGHGRSSIGRFDGMGVPSGARTRRKGKGKGVNRPSFDKGPEVDLLTEVMAVGNVDEWVDACHGDPEMAARVIIELAAELAAQQAKVQTLRNQLKKRTKQ